MLEQLPDLPAGTPDSLWFLIAAVVVVILQAFPVTGIFLMFAMAFAWAGLLITAGMIGIGWEVLTGEAAAIWLALPVLYFGGYYLVFGWERLAVHRMAREIAAFNAGKRLRFDPDERDLVFVKGKGDLHLSPAALLETYDLPRIFEHGMVFFIGSAEARRLANGEPARSSGIYTSGLSTSRKRGIGESLRRTPEVQDMVFIRAPAQPGRPMVEIISDRTKERRQLVPLQLMDFTVRDTVSGEAIQLRAAFAALLSPFPFVQIGYFLNSGAAKWQGFAGWWRSRPRPLNVSGQPEPAPDGHDIIAAALGLEASTDIAARAAGVETVAALTKASDTARTQKDLAILEAMLADPLTFIKDSWLFHLPNRPAVVTPYADRIVAALAKLQASNLRGSETGRNLWRLVAVLPDADLAPYRHRLVAWLDPAAARPWTQKTGEIYARLDAAVPAERAILLDRLETQRSDLETKLLASFSRMGSAAPAEVKERLLELWRARAPDPAKPRARTERTQEDTVLYFTLARLGLKEQAGQVVQRYFGPTFTGIWLEVDADTHPDLRGLSSGELSNHFRRR